MARKMIDWSGLEFRLGFLGPGIEVNEVFHNPVQIVNGNGKGGMTGIRINGAGPPRCRHDDSEESMQSRDVQPTPVHSLCILVGVWPRRNGPPLWLTATPPDDPVLMELPYIGDGRNRITLVSPVDDLLGAGPQRQPSHGLDRHLANNTGQ